MDEKQPFERPGILIQLADNKKGAEDSSDIQILKTGVFSHAWYGDFEVLRTDIKKMVDNFEGHILKTDLMIDYNHDLKEAAGWVARLYHKEDMRELWAEVKWTAPGKQHLADKTFRYISADFTFNHMDNETLEEFGPVLYGAALTNRPFVKGMAPTVNLMERKNLTGGNPMLTLEDLKKENQQLTDRVSTLSKDKDNEIKVLSDSISDKDKVIVDLKKENDDLKLEQGKAKKEGEFAVMLSDGHAVPAQKEAFLKGDLAEFAKLSQPTKVITQGHGKTGKGDNNQLSGEEKEREAIKLAEEKFKEGGFETVGDALSVILEEKPELAS